MKLTTDQIKEIAEKLECGFKVFINKDTLEIKSILDWDEMLDPEPWEEDLEEIEYNWSSFVVLEKLASNEAFRIMEDFIEQVDDKTLCKNLEKALNRKKPFANFKYEVESSDYRQEWFDFRSMKYIEHVKERLKDEGIEFEF